MLKGRKRRKPKTWYCADCERWLTSLAASKHGYGHTMVHRQVVKTLHELYRGAA